MHCCNINKSRRGGFFSVHLVHFCTPYLTVCCAAQVRVQDSTVLSLTSVTSQHLADYLHGILRVAAAAADGSADIAEMRCFVVCGLINTRVAATCWYQFKKDNCI